MPNHAHFLVKLDLRRLQKNLASNWKRPLTDIEVGDFLINAGFRRVPDGWVTREDRLMRLDPSEVLSAEKIDPRGTITV